MAIITPDNPAFGTAARDVGTPAYDPKKHDPFFDGLRDRVFDVDDLWSRLLRC